jgi:hypothetical protein
MAAALHAHLAPQDVDWHRLQALTEDKVHVAPAYTGPACANPTLEIWGIRVRSADYGEGHYEEFTGFPLAGIATPEAIDAYPWPDAGWFDYAGLAAAIPADGTRAVQVLPTMVRVVCQNTLNTALGHPDVERMLRVQHTGDVKEKIRQAQQVLGIVRKANANFVRAVRGSEQG